MGYNSTGLLGTIERDYLDKQSIPLNESRKLVGWSSLQHSDDRSNTITSSLVKFKIDVHS